MALPHISDPEFANWIGRLEDCYKSHLGGDKREVHVDPLGYGRWTTDYLTERESGRDHEQATQIVLERIHQVAGINPVPEPGPTPEPGDFPRRTGIPVLRGRQFHDAGGPFFALGATYMHGVSTFHENRQLFDRDMRDLQAHGVNYIRIIGFLDGGNISPDPWERAGNTDAARIGPMIDYAYDTYGIRTFFTVFGGLRHWPTSGDRRRAVDRACDIIEARREKVLGAEITNEYWMNWPVAVTEMKDLGRVMRSRLGPDFVISHSALRTIAEHDGVDERQIRDEARQVYGDSAANIWTPHYSRDVHKVDGVWRAYRQPWEHVVYDENGRALTPQASINNEAIGLLSSVAEDSDPGRQTIAAVISMIAGEAGYVLHSDAGVWGGRLVNYPPRPYAALTDHPTMRQVLVGLAGVMRDLPASLPSWSRTRHLLADHPFAPSFQQTSNGSSQIWPDGGSQGVVRPYAAYSGNSFVVSLLGVRNYFDIKPARPMRIRIVNAAGWSTVWEGELRPGQTHRLEAARAAEAIVIGDYI